MAGVDEERHQRQRNERGPGGHHIERRGCALVGGIRDEEAEVVFVDHEEIVEIAAHFPYGVYAGIQVEHFAFRKGRGQRARLNMCGHIQLGLRGGQLIALLVE